MQDKESMEHTDELCSFWSYILRKTKKNKPYDNTGLSYYYNCVFLSDWKHTISFGLQISNIRWFHSKTYVPFGAISTTNGCPKHPKKYFLSKKFKKLNECEISAIEHVFETTKNLTRYELKRLVCSTYPIRHIPTGHGMNLVALAKEYEPERKKYLLQTLSKNLLTSK